MSSHTSHSSGSLRADSVSGSAGAAPDLSVQLGRLSLPNPILTASGTFGYAREMAGIVNLARLGGIIPKTITAAPRAGNAPWRTIETAGGMLNSIGLDNDGIDAFIAGHLPYLSTLDAPVIVSIAGRTKEEFVAMASRLTTCDGITALELNISCPNVTGGDDFGTDPEECASLVRSTVENCRLPILAKLTPNVTDIVAMAQAVAENGADAVSLINTCLGVAIDWRRQRPMLGNMYGGLSGPAIKPIALAAVCKVAEKVNVPIVGIGGIANIDDVMQFLVAGASAVQIGTANFYNPTVCTQILDALPAALGEIGASSVGEIVGTLRRPASQFREAKMSKKLIGTTARTGERCPESGVWQSIDHPSTTAPFAEGNVMPPSNGKTVTWKLVADALA